MKTEREIRAHRDALAASLKKGCDCAGTEHEAECFVGGKMVESAIQNLSWVLGENEDMERLVEEFAYLAKQP